MNPNKKMVNKGMTISTMLIFMCIVARIGIAIWENYNLVSNFTPNPDEPYQQQKPMAEENFIDDYIYRLYSPFAVTLIGLPNTFVLKRPINLLFIAG